MLVDLNPEKLRYNPFMASLYRCGGSCNTVTDLFGRICVPTKEKCKLESIQYDNMNK